MQVPGGARVCIPGGAVLQRRVQALVEQGLGLSTRDVCAANLVFQRTARIAGLDFWTAADACWPIHEHVLQVVRLRVVVAFGNSDTFADAYLAKKLFRIGDAIEFPAGHASWPCRGFRTAWQCHEFYVAGIPHISYYSPTERNGAIKPTPGSVAARGVSRRAVGLAATDLSPCRPPCLLSLVCARVALDPARAVRCQQPGCHHSVYAAVHVVQEGGRILMLGSTCVGKRYGTGKALGTAQWGSGQGRRLSDEERQILLANTAKLIARFEREDQLHAEALARTAAAHHEEQLAIQEEARMRLAKLRQLADRASPSRQVTLPAPGTRRGPGNPAETPPWRCSPPRTVIAGWRVQHRDDSQKLLPWPDLVGWEAALPSSVGQPHPAVQGYHVPDIGRALHLLQAAGFSGPRVGRWSDVLPRRRR